MTRRIFTTCIFAALVATAQKPGPPLSQTYRDPQTGISFQYPASWAQDPQPNDILMMETEEGQQNPKITFSFVPKGNPYKKTTLENLAFSYAVHPATSNAGCIHSFTAEVSAPDNPKPITTNGIPFSEFHQVNVGLCKGQSADVDIAFVSGKCIAFERDFNTKCFDPDDGRRELTPKEVNSLQRHLDAIMQSVRFTDKP